MNLEERSSLMEKTAGLEGLKSTEKLCLLYDLYYESGDSDHLGDFLLNAERVGFSIAFNILFRTCKSMGLDFFDCLQELSICLMNQIRSDLSKGRRHTNILHMVRHFYKVRSVDMFRNLIKDPYYTKKDSLEQKNQSPDGKPIDKVEDTEDEEEQLYEEEKAELFDTLTKLYIQDLMASNAEPSQIMALCYARILYQLEALYDWDRIEAAADKRIAEDTRQKYTDLEKITLAFEAVRKTGKPVSPEWAFERMDLQTFSRLTEDSQQTIQRLYDRSLSWQQPYLHKLSQPFREDLLWRDAIYTECFHPKQTSAWSHSLHKKICEQMMDQIAADRELDSNVQRLDNPLKTMMRTSGRRTSYASYDQ